MIRSLSSSSLVRETTSNRVVLQKIEALTPGSNPRREQAQASPAARGRPEKQFRSCGFAAGFFTTKHKKCSLQKLMLHAPHGHEQILAEDFRNCQRKLAKYIQNVKAQSMARRSKYGKMLYFLANIAKMCANVSCVSLMRFQLSIRVDH